MDVFAAFYFFLILSFAFFFRRFYLYPTFFPFLISLWNSCISFHRKHFRDGTQFDSFNRSPSRWISQTDIFPCSLVCFSGICLMDARILFERSFESFLMRTSFIHLTPIKSKSNLFAGNRNHKSNAKQKKFKSNFPMRSVFSHVERFN